MDDLMDRLQTRSRAWRSWVESHRDIFFDLVRIYLGIGLFVKGLQFIWDDTLLTRALNESGNLDVVPSLMLHYIPLAHLGGGALLAIGLLTRIAALFQLPILFGAAFVVYMPEGFLTYDQGFEFTALVLFLLTLVLIHGAGRLSIDYRLKNKQLQR